MQRSVMGLIAAILLFMAPILFGSSLKEEGKNGVHILSVISEPEGNAIREIILDRDGEGVFDGISIYLDDKLDVKVNRDEFAKSEILVATVMGVESFFIKVVDIQETHFKLQMRYLESAPANFKSFILTFKKNSQGQYAIFDTTGKKEIRWIFLSENSLLGIPIGIESYKFSYHKPKI